MDYGQDLFHCTLLCKQCVEDEIAETLVRDQTEVQVQVLRDRVQVMSQVFRVQSSSQVQADCK